MNPAATITEADRSKVNNLIRKELADRLSGNQSYYPDGVQKDSQTLASDLGAFIDSIQKLQGRVDDPSGILGGAVTDLKQYAKAFETVREANEPNDQIEVPRESLPNTRDQNEIFPDLGPLSPINPLVPNQRKEDLEASINASDELRGSRGEARSSVYPQLRSRVVSSEPSPNPSDIASVGGRPPQPDVTNVMPVRSLMRVDGNNSPASGFGSSAPTVQFALPGSPNSSGGIANWIASLAGIDPQNTQAAPSSQADQLRGFYGDDPLQPWFTRRPR